MKNKQLITLFCLTLLTPVWAKNTETTPVKTAEVTPEQSLQKKLDVLEKFSARFEQVVYDKKGNVLQRAEGVPFIERPNHFFWETKSPDKNTIISDGKSVCLKIQVCSIHKKWTCNQLLSIRHFC